MTNDEKTRVCVYAIESEVSNRIYVGQTDDLERRLKEHNERRVRSAKYEAPWRNLAVEFILQTVTNQMA